MDNLENQPSSPSSSQPASQPAAPASIVELQEAYESLRHLVVSILVLLIVISGAFNLFLWRQVKFNRADLEAARPQVNQMMAEYNRVSGPVINNFIKSLVDYSRTHPDFTPILTKYGIKPNPAAAAAPGTPTPATPTAAAPKK